MSAALILAGAMLAQTATPETPGPEHVDVAYAELAQGQSDAAVSRIIGSDALRASDPAALINLGTAYARIGRMTEARSCFERAIASRERYDLELADGRWMDSRRAARAALNLLEQRETLALASRDRS